MKLALFLFMTLTACTHKSGTGGASNLFQDHAGDRFEIEVDSPQDRVALKAIEDAEITDRTAKQIQFLKDHGHDIQWFDDSVATVSSHQTVQVVYFDYGNHVISWCSGGLLANDHVSTAGHCNEGELTYSTIEPGDAPLDCRGRVLFAFKRSKTEPVEYFGCDQLQVQVYQKSDTSEKSEEGGRSYRKYVLSDYALFSLMPNDLVTGIVPAFEHLRLAVDYDKSQFAKSSGPGWETMGVAVDPPKDGNRYVSKLKLIYGEIVDEFAYFRGGLLSPNSIYISAKKNIGIPGNSGSPIYAHLNSKSIHLTDGFNAGESDWFFISPWYGWRNWNLPNGMVRGEIYTRPDLVYNAYKSFLK